MLKKLPIGLDEFHKLTLDDYYYVDKTMFIADLLKGSGEVNLFTRPRRFGKSLNMSMLKEFFEIGTDKGIFSELNISCNTDICNTYMGQFPVISITLKNVDGLNYSQALSSLCKVIGKEALRFRFLSESEKLSYEEKQLYLQLIQVGDGQKNVFKMSEDVAISSIQLLSFLLEKHYGKKTIILIDEYDVPLDKAFHHGYYDKMVFLIRNFLGEALKGNSSLQFAVLTGCLRISKESIFTGLNNPKIHGIEDEQFSEYFGFTQEEVSRLLAYYRLSSHMDTMKEWYNGYQFGTTSIYCPWDVINYCYALNANAAAEPEDYWANTSGNDMVKRFISLANQTTRNEIETLIAGESITKEINKELTYNELDTNIENLWSVLFMTGYLTIKEKISSKKMCLVIPNREILDLFVSTIQIWFKEQINAEPQKIKALCKAFLQGDTNIIQQSITKYLKQTISIRDTFTRKAHKENFYHGILLGLLSYPDQWIVKSNAESGDGYSDIVIMDMESPFIKSAAR
ncbi:MAG: AAA family ATPase [Lachnospiraceae bacterium]|nr:AAA family ATPase [Lachnospiraceae bacterium]